MTDAPTLAVLPSLPLDERRDLPDTAAIYFVLVGDTVLYIGQQCWRQSRMLTAYPKSGRDGNGAVTSGTRRPPPTSMESPGRQSTLHARTRHPAHLLFG